MKTPHLTRVLAVAASLLISFVTVQAIADYALPGAGPVQVAAAR